MRFFMTIAIVILVTGAAVAQDNPPTQKLGQEVARSAVEKSGPVGEDQQATLLEGELKRAMNEEIALRVASEQETVATLTARLEDAVSSQVRLEIQRQIVDAKQTSWRDVLALQLKYAELGGYTEQAAELQARVERLDEGLSANQSAPASTRRDAQANKGGK